jgi:hypothetical protein
MSVIYMLEIIFLTTYFTSGSYGAAFKGELALKLYFARKQIVIEFVDAGLKKKLVVSFERIDELDLMVDVPGLDTKIAVFSMHLTAPPAIFNERNPVPKLNTMWVETADDFCNGCSLLFARISLLVKKASAKRHLNRLRDTCPEMAQLLDNPARRNLLSKCVIHL